MVGGGDRKDGEDSPAEAPAGCSPDERERLARRLLAARERLARELEALALTLTGKPDQKAEPERLAQLRGLLVGARAELEQVQAEADTCNQIEPTEKEEPT